ncbi:4'-phosphopantetheinyl transferase superfamily protein [Streptomyces sp. NPDC005251]|uniref:4'-phosphopantetheinyl transferase superfamily protein n=1 Tax=unclassified Streptomyces TaxID=2593676 RepID=UPI0033A8A59E
MNALAPGIDRQTAVQKCWTRKEALLKAVGIGISRDLGRIETKPGSDSAVVSGSGTTARAPRSRLLAACAPAPPTCPPSPAGRARAP